MMMLCRINAGPVALDSWLIDSEVGGGRIIGEVCHFVDFFHFFMRESSLSQLVLREC